MVREAIEDRAALEVEFMSEEEAWRAQVMTKLDHVGLAVERLEKRYDKDSEDLFERLRKVEIDCALTAQAHDTWKTQSRRDFAILAALVGTGGGAVASAIAKLIGG